MKNRNILAVIALSAAMSVAAASATEVGAQFVHNGSTVTNSYGVVVNQPLGGGFGLEGAVDRSTIGSNDFNRWCLLGTKTVAHLGDFAVDVRAGGAMITTQNINRTYALVAGAGVSYPLTKYVSISVDYSYESGQQNASAFDGNMVSVGLKFSL